MYLIYVYYDVFNSKSHARSSCWFCLRIYSGLTVTGVVLFAVLKLNQVPKPYGIIGIILIIIGVIMVNYLGKLN